MRRREGVIEKSVPQAVASVTRGKMIEDRFATGRGTDLLEGVAVL